MADGLIVGATLTNRATRLEAVVATRMGEILRCGHRTALAPLTPDVVIAELRDLAAELASGLGAITSYVLALEAIIDGPPGVVLEHGTLPEWHHVSLAEQIAAATGQPARILTLTEAALLAELRWGAAQGARSLAYVDLGRTITAALWDDRRLIRHPYLGQIGHLPIRADGPRCACGAQGHLEAIASSQAIVRWMIGRLAEAPATLATVLQLTGGRAEALQAPQIWDLARAGDPVARDLLEEANAALAWTALTLLLMLDVDWLVLDGPLARADRSWLEDVRARAARLAPPRRANALAERIHVGSAADGLRGAVAWDILQSDA